MNTLYKVLHIGFSTLTLLLAVFAFNVRGNAETVNLAEGRSYILQTPANDSYPDPGLNLLTDGKLGANDGIDCGERLCVPGWVGFDRGVPIITVDLEHTYRLQSVSVSFLSFPSAGIHPPLSIELLSSYDGIHWKPCGRLERKPSHFELAHNVYASRYLRFIVERKQWAFLDEIVVTGDRTPIVNLAEGRSYTLQTPANDGYPDPDSNLLTDGKLGANDGIDCGERACAPGWVGFDRGVPIITVDLEHTYRLQSVSVSFLSFPSAGIHPPLSIELLSSYDGIHWKPCGRLERKPSHFELAHNVYASRYLRFIVERKQWAFLDEIVVTGDGTPIGEPMKRILVVSSDLPENDERQLRLVNILDGMGLDFDMIDAEQLDTVDFIDYQLLVFASSSKVALTISISQEQRLLDAVTSGANILFIGGGIWGSFKSTALPEAFGVRYIKQDSNERVGVRFAEYRNLDGKTERLPLKHETVWVVEPTEAQVVSWYLNDDGRQLEIPFITRMKGDAARGIALYVSLPLLDRWKKDETYFTYARAEILTSVIRSLMTDGVVAKHPVAKAHDAVFLMRLEDYTPGGVYMGHGVRSWLIRMNKLLALTEQYKVPLNIGIIPKYAHPFFDETHDWGEKDSSIIQLKQMAQTAFERGGSLIVHGYDHQNDDGIDDFSGDDWEMWNEDAEAFLPLEQQKLITDSAYAEIEKQWGIRPVIWETPHYISNADTFRAAHNSGFRYFTESDTKIFPNWNGYHNHANGLMLNIPETGAFFQLSSAEVKHKTLIKQLYILPRIVRMNALFLVFYHNMLATMHHALENLFMTSSNFDLWKPNMETYAKFWEKRHRVEFDSNIDRIARQIHATVDDAFDGFTLAIQLPHDTVPAGVTINGEGVDVKRRQIQGSWILYPVLNEGTHDVVVTYQ